MMWRRHRGPETRRFRERSLQGDQSIRTAEEIVSVAWINRLRFAAEDDQTMVRMLKHERTVHLHAAARRSRAAAAAAREWGALTSSLDHWPSEQTQS